MENIINKRQGFILMLRSKQLLKLLERRQSAFVLLTLIALRARRTAELHFDELKIGEALIGDYKSYGATEQIYKTDKKFLEKYGLATFKSTNRGTIASLISTTIFDINEEKPIINNPTDEKQTVNEQSTINNNVNNEKKDIYSFKSKKSPSMFSLVSCSTEELETLSRKFRVPYEYTKSKQDDLLDKIKEGSFKGNNVYFTLTQWIRYDIRKGNITPKPYVLPNEFHRRNEELSQKIFTPPLYLDRLSPDERKMTQRKEQKEYNEAFKKLLEEYEEKD
jgi:hypothetical protein